MASGKPRVSHKSTNSDIPLPRHRPRLSEDPPKAFPGDADSAMLCSPAQQRLPKHPRPKLHEALAASPYASALQAAPNLQRSLSVAKSNGRNGKQISPAKEKAATMMNFARSEVAINRVKASSNEPRPKPAREALNQTTYPKDVSSDVSFTASFNASVLFPSMDSPRSHGQKRMNQPKSVKAVEANFQKAVRELGQEDRAKEVALYSQTFAEVIALTPTCKSLLTKIKSKYDDWLSRAADSEEVSKFQGEIQSLQASLAKEVEEKNLLTWRLEKLSRENTELSKSCEGFQSKCYEYEEKLYQLANVQLEGFPPTEEAWKLLVAELGSYKVWKAKVVKELRLSQAKEKKLLTLLHAMKSRGYPVEEVYNSDVRRPAKSQRSSVHSQDSEDEPETLSYGTPKVKKKPEAVPDLKLDGVERDILSSSSDLPALDESLRQAISLSATKPSVPSSAPDSQKPLKIIPKLAIPDGLNSSDNGFQQEFLSKYSEYSESWRKQIDALKH